VGSCEHEEVAWEFLMPVSANQGVLLEKTVLLGLPLHVRGKRADEHADALSPVLQIRRVA
jgi:hypothetical protein